MATLANVNGASLVPDMSQGLNALSSAFGTPQSRRANEAELQRYEAETDIKQSEAARAQQAADAAGEYAEQIEDPQEQALFRLASLDPGLATAAQAIKKSGDDRVQAEVLRTVDGSARAVAVGRSLTPEQATQHYADAANQAAAAGDMQTAQKMLELANADPDSRSVLEMRLTVAATDMTTLLAPPTAPEIKTYESDGEKIAAQFNPSTGQYDVIGRSRPAPLTEMGKAFEDYRRGNIDRDSLNSIMTQTSGLQTPEQIEQVRQIAQIKADAERDKDPELRAARLAKYQADVEKARQANKASETTIRKGEEMKADAVRLIDQLLEDKDAIRSVVGPFDDSFLSLTLMDGSLKAATDIKQLKNILTAENLGIMTGVLSETDMKIISGIAGGGLDTGGEQEAFIDELVRVRGKLAGGQSGSNMPVPGESVTLPGGIIMTVKD